MKREVLSAHRTSRVDINYMCLVFIQCVISTLNTYWLIRGKDINLQSFLVTQNEQTKLEDDVKENDEEKTLAQLEMEASSQMED